MTMREMFEERGIPWGELTPDQEFQAYSAQQFRPGPSAMRSAFWDARNPLMQQYRLSQPWMSEYGTFADFMGQMGQTSGDTAWLPYGGKTLAQRAKEAALLAGLTESQFFQYMAPQPEAEYDTAADYQAAQITADEQARMNLIDEDQMIMYRNIYGTGEGALAQQAALANMLALQRTGAGQTGMYGGAYGQAVGSAMEELQRQLAIRNPETNFLDWYLARVGDTGMGTGGLLRAPEVAAGA